MTNNSEVYKTFDRSTPAGRAMWALYNASGNEASKIGNSYSKKNGEMWRLTDWCDKADLLKIWTPDPEDQRPPL